MADPSMTTFLANGCNKLDSNHNYYHIAWLLLCPSALALPRRLNAANRRLMEFRPVYDLCVVPCRRDFKFGLAVRTLVVDVDAVAVLLWGTRVRWLSPGYFERRLTPPLNL